MSSRLEEKPIFIATSKFACIIISSCYALLILGLFLTRLPLWLCTFLILILACDYRRVLSLYALGSHIYSVIGLQYDCGKWVFSLRNGRSYKGKLCKHGSFSSAVVLILKMQHYSGTRSIIIPRDCLSKHNYRFLAFHINNA